MYSSESEEAEERKRREEKRRNLPKVSGKSLEDEEWVGVKVNSQTDRQASTAFTSSHMQLKTNIWFNYRFCSRNRDGKQRVEPSVASEAIYVGGGGECTLVNGDDCAATAVVAVTLCLPCLWLRWSLLFSRLTAATATAALLPPWPALVPFDSFRLFPFPFPFPFSRPRRSVESDKFCGYWPKVN